MSIDFDPQVEENQHPSSNPAENMEGRRVVRWELEERDGKETVREKVVEEDYIDKVSEHDPDLPRTSSVYSHNTYESIETHVEFDRDGLQSSRQSGNFQKEMQTLTLKS
jgi:hypothetical protein